MKNNDQYGGKIKHKSRTLIWKTVFDLIKNKNLRVLSENNLKVVAQELQLSYSQTIKLTEKVKDVSELKVAYLAGANPQNDGDILIREGIKPKNIYAFETKKDDYQKGMENIKGTLSAKINLSNKNIRDFFKVDNTKFDIIYLDFTNDSFDKIQLETVFTIFEKQRLSDVGILITNFSRPFLTRPETENSGYEIMPNREKELEHLKEILILSLELLSTNDLQKKALKSFYDQQDTEKPFEDWFIALPFQHYGQF